ncbi:MAG: tRNA (adenosine(37)-N6)-threonylcarbamoyltransferase complex dimerization subunit type 1 TsaB [Spirochaetaceae bacterium]|jgi:tRNA threonylcarbamoyladenosine biosynthesis protein TsaB|nr:tRNA (adenosine(37)-N6)-threonylcarbamoyltransferase complex dimerization subunit type 1 TsaB [Spirochaetaceae bacterium]
MNILAIDTATSLFSAAVSSPAGIFQFETDTGPKHSEILLETIDYLVRAAGLEPKDLELAACMQGPGSFTGVRIGFAAVKGIALALGIPFVAAPTLDCIAAPSEAWPGLVIPAIDAKQNRFFTALYRQNERLTDFMDADAGEIARAVRAAGQGRAGETAALVTGPDSALLAPLLAGILGENQVARDPASRKGKSRELLEFSRKKYILIEKGGFSFEEPAPIYLRKSDAEIKSGPKHPE